MPASADFFWRSGLFVASSVVAFLVALFVLGLIARGAKRGTPYLAVIYWLFFAGMAAPLVAAALFHSEPQSATVFSIVAFGLALVAAFAAARAGYSRAIAAAGIGVVVQWLLHQFLAWAYSLLVQ